MFEAHQLVVRRWLRAEEQFVELSDRRAIQLYGSLEKTNKAERKEHVQTCTKKQRQMYVIKLLVY